MFTGIVDHYGQIIEILTLEQSQRLWIKTNFTSLEMGESIAVNGICLTVTGIEYDKFSCDISPETCRITTAKNFKAEMPVNLERAMQASSRMGGHMVMGHVDQTATLICKTNIDEFVEMKFGGLNAEARNFVIKKGSIAVNGVSLTINHTNDDTFTVMLIPHTLDRTTLSFLREGDAVNIEFDMMARIIVEQCQRYLSAKRGE